MKNRRGGVPKVTVFTTHRVQARSVEPPSPARSADEALLAFVLGRPVRAPEPPTTAPPPEEN